MTLRFTSLKKLMDFLHASHTANFEFSTTMLTLTADFPYAAVNLAATFGATVLEETYPGETNHSFTHT